MTEKLRGRTVLIAGPTASGKSALALRLAQQVDGVIINADSMQVYRELRILTARPTAEDESAAPHALYGFVAGAEAYSAGRYATDAARAIEEARNGGRVPIIVGGTGLYFKALLEGLSPMPPIDPVVRARWRSEAMSRTAPDLHAELASRDATMAARLMPMDRQRVVRALEVLDSTGRSLAEWQAQKGTPVLCEQDTVRLLAQPEPATHSRAIDARVDAMMSTGALDEVRNLLKLKLSDGLPVMRALGVAQLAALLAGSVSSEDAASAVKTATRQYAKRQQTWFRRNMISWIRVTEQYMERFSAVRFLFDDR